MSEQDKQGNGQPDAFTALMGPIALDQAEKALAIVVAAYVGKIAAMKMLATREDLPAAMNMGEYMLVEFAMATYNITRSQATDVIRNAIQQARYGIRHTA